MNREKFQATVYEPACGQGHIGKLDIPGKQYWTGLNNKDSKINKGVTTIKPEKNKE